MSTREMHAANRQTPKTRGIIARMHWIFCELLEARGPVTALSLAVKYEVHRKTIYRDLDYLRSINVNLITSEHGFQLVGGVCPFCQQAIAKGAK